MPILELQKRARELGRIRIGQQVEGTNRKGETYTRPEKLDRFRLTCASKTLLDRVAALYGGQVVAWDGAGTKQWEVVTDSNRIPILVPPNPVTQWLETWSAGGCVHRCDGKINVLTDEPCDPDDENHVAAKPTTRLSVVLRDVEGVGVWRLESHGWNSAIELPDSAEFLAQAGGYVEGYLSLEERVSKGTNARTGKPETRKFMVPIIEIDVTPAELLAGRGRVGAPSVEGPMAARALESGPPDYFAMAAAAETPDEVNAVWFRAKEAGHLTGVVLAAIKAAAARIAPPAAEALAAPPADEDGPDADVVWGECIRVAGEMGWTLYDLEDNYAEAHGGTMSTDASAAELTAYLEVLHEKKAAA